MKCQDQDATPYIKESKKCSLCTIERLQIIKLHKSEPARALNKREELGGKCLHRRKHLLGMVSTLGDRKTHENSSQNERIRLRNTQNNNSNEYQSNNYETHEISSIPREETGKRTTDLERSSGRTRSGRSWRNSSVQNDPG